MFSPIYEKRATTAFLRAAVFFAVAAAITAIPCMAAPPPCFDPNGVVVPCQGLGGLRFNGTRSQPTDIRADSVVAAGVPQNFFTAAGFLFEPESPYSSLKEAPIWHELEQLLDNPYAVTPDPRTLGNYDGYPSYRATGVHRRPSFIYRNASGQPCAPPTPGHPNPGCVRRPLPSLLTHALNYNPTNVEEMRLLNPNYPGGLWWGPGQLFAENPADPNSRWGWTYDRLPITPGVDRVLGPEIDYNGPAGPDATFPTPVTADSLPPDTFEHCITNLELVPPEGVLLCGGDPGEPNYAGFGVFRNDGYSTPVIRQVAGRPSDPGDRIPALGLGNHRLYDPSPADGVPGGAPRGFINPRNPNTGVGGLRKPSLRIPDADGTPHNPNFLFNWAPNLAARGGDDQLAPSNENDYYRESGGTVRVQGPLGGPFVDIPTGRSTAVALGKALFWDMQVGSDGVQSCGDPGPGQPRV